MWSSPLSMSIAVLSPMCIRTDFSSQIAKTEPGGIWRKITADARTPKMPYFQGFPHLFASKTQWKSESESLLRFRRVLTDFRKSLLEFLIEPSTFSPQNHAFGSAWKAPVMPDCTQSRIGKCRGGIKIAVTVCSVFAIDLNYSRFMRQEDFGVSPFFKEEYRRMLQVLLSNTVFIWTSPTTGFASLQTMLSKTDEGIRISGTSLFIAWCHK